MQVEQLYVGNSYRNFNYLCFEKDTGECAVIDPYDFKLIINRVKNLSLEVKYLFNTHGHWDHIKANNEVLDSTGCKFPKIVNKEKIVFSSGQYIECLFTPGHTMEHFCFLIYKDHNPFALIAGDTLFNAGVGNCKNGGNPEKLYDSVVNILGNLDDSVLIYPGHDYLLNNLKFAQTIEPGNEHIQEYIEKREKMDLDKEFIQTTMGIERKINPFLRLDSEEIQEKFGTKDSKEIFINLRKLRDKW